MIKIQENNGALEAILDTYVRVGKQTYTANCSFLLYHDCAVEYSTYAFVSLYSNNAHFEARYKLWLKCLLYTEPLFDLVTNSV